MELKYIRTELSMHNITNNLKNKILILYPEPTPPLLSSLEIIKFKNKSFVSLNLFIYLI